MSTKIAEVINRRNPGGAIISKTDEVDIVRVHGCVLFIGARHIEFPIKVRKALRIKNLVLVLLAPKGELTPNRNIFCYDLSGNLIWEIEEFRPDLIDEGRAYSGLWIEPDGRVLAYNTCGFDVEVDLETGKISNFEFTK